MRTVVIHQPNYLPGCTYFDKLASADVFVSLDTVQYTKNNWINRNRIKTANGLQWITVPVHTKGRSTQSIFETEIDIKKDWQRDHARTLEQNYARAPFFDAYGPALIEALGRPWTRLAEMNEHLLRMLCAWLGTDVPLVRASNLNVSGSSTDLLLNICEAVGADRYLSGPGGRKYMDVHMFAARGVELVFHDYHHPVYPQLHGPFEENLSAIDLLFNVGEEAIASFQRPVVGSQSRGKE